jgi:hypothetical protein
MNGTTRTVFIVDYVRKVRTSPSRVLAAAGYRVRIRVGREFPD